jgi:hypothetical protein
MGLGHEKLDVYRLSIGYVAWVYEKADGLTGNHRSARDQWLRASQSIGDMKDGKMKGYTPQREGMKRKHVHPHTHTPTHIPPQTRKRHSQQF